MRNFIEDGEGLGIGFSEDSLCNGLVDAWDRLSDKAKKELEDEMRKPGGLVLDVSEEKAKYKPMLKLMKRIGEQIGKNQVEEVSKILSRG